MIEADRGRDGGTLFCIIDENVKINIFAYSQSCDISKEFPFLEGGGGSESM